MLGSEIARVVRYECPLRLDAYRLANLSPMIFVAPIITTTIFSA